MPEAGARSPGAGRAARAVTVAVCCSTVFVIAVDTTVVNLALPLIARGLRTPVSGLQWTIAAYSICAASLMLTSGSAGDRFGRRTVLLAGLSLFTAASAGCGLAPGTGWLIAFRAAQGAAGSALTPMAVGVLTAAYPDPAARARVLGLWTGTFGLGMAGGPVVGGLLAAAWGWRSLFWINVPLGLAAIIAAALVIPESRAARPRGLDLPGQVLVFGFLGSLCFGIIEGPVAGWRSPLILAALSAGAAALALLAGWERRAVTPLLEPRVFRSVPFTGALLATVISFACLGGFLFLTTLYLQDTLGLSVLRAGVALLPVAVATALAGPLAGRVLARHGGRLPLMAGGAALAAGCFTLAQAPAPASWALLSAAYLVFGAGYGAINAVIAAVAVDGLPRDQAGVAGGITSAGRQAGQSLGVSVTGSVLAISLHSAIGRDFAAATHPAWVMLGECGLAVALLGLIATARGPARPRANRSPPVNRHTTSALSLMASSRRSAVNSPSGQVTVETIHPVSDEYGRACLGRGR